MEIKVTLENVGAYLHNAVHQFCNENGLFDDGVDIGEDHQGVSVVIVQEHEQMDRVEGFINELDEGIPSGIYSIDFIKVIFADEVDTCSECGKVIYTIPSYHGWKPDYWMSEYGRVCEQCTLENPEGYIEHLVNNPDSANTFLSNEKLEELGFIKLDEIYENGFHQGMNDDPNKIFNKLKDKYYDIIFNISETSQFYVTFDVYVKQDRELEEVS